MHIDLCTSFVQTPPPMLVHDWYHAPRDLRIPCLCVQCSGSSGQHTDARHSSPCLEIHPCQHFSPPHPFSSSILFPFCSSFFVAPPHSPCGTVPACYVPLGKVIDTLRHVSLPFGRHATSIPIYSASWNVLGSEWKVRAEGKYRL